MFYSKYRLDVRIDWLLCHNIPFFEVIYISALPSVLLGHPSQSVQHIPCKVWLLPQPAEPYTIWQI